MGSLLSTSADPNEREEDDDISSFVILEVCSFQETLEDCDIAFQKLKDVSEETRKGLQEIEPKLHHNQREVQIATFTGNAFASVGFLLRTIGIVKAIPTFGASLWIALAGGAFSMGGHLTSTGAAMLGEIVQDRTYSRALALLQNFVAIKSEYLTLVKTACEEIRSSREGDHLEEYREIVELMSEYLTLLQNHPEAFSTSKDAGNFSQHSSEGVTSFVGAVKTLGKGGAEVTLTSLAKLMNPLRVVVDVGLLAYSLMELCKNEECKYEQLVDLMVEAVDKDMELMDSLHCKLNSFVFLQSKSAEKVVSLMQN